MAFDNNSESIYSPETEPQPATSSHDYQWLRNRIAMLREEIDGLIKPIYWTPYLGDTCTQLKAARGALLAARDASHVAEARLNATNTVEG